MVQYEESSPIVQNRNVRVITKHSIIPFKSTQQPANELKTIEENPSNNQNQSNNNTYGSNSGNNNGGSTNNEGGFNIDMKKNKRLSDVGLGQEEINKLITKLGVDKNEKKKEEGEETKDNRTKNMTNSGVMVFGGRNSIDHSQENGSVSPMKNSAVIQNYDASTMSPMKVF